MIRTESRVIVAGSIGDVWDYLCDVGRWPEWAPTVVDCRVRGGGALRPGGWIEQRAKDAGLGHRRVERVTGIVPPTSLTFAGTMWTMPSRWGMRLAAVGDRHTVALMWVEVDVPRILRAFPGRALRHSIERVGAIEMAGVKAAVEGATREDAGSR
ncbi:SRPBCC family protein [Leifsonia sp. AG29]|uniref:SRPBCC family protein n=1 Tax=Leifsonia sp. AG29 TaxID=2598860 RepID=UPI00131D05AF|nr:SRPBCC family protein [Leifsonia sp. AG29]